MSYSFYDIKIVLCQYNRFQVCCSKNSSYTCQNWQKKKYNKSDVSCFGELSTSLDSYSIKLIVLEKKLLSNCWKIGDHQAGVWWQGKYVVEEFRARRFWRERKKRERDSRVNWPIYKWHDCLTAGFVLLFFNVTR